MVQLAVVFTILIATVGWEVQEQDQAAIPALAVILALQLQGVVHLVLEQLIIPPQLTAIGMRIIVRRWAMHLLGGAGRAGRLRLVPTPVAPTPTAPATSLSATMVFALSRKLAPPPQIAQRQGLIARRAFALLHALRPRLALLF